MCLFRLNKIATEPLSIRRKVNYKGQGRGKIPLRRNDSKKQYIF